MRMSHINRVEEFLKYQPTAGRVQVAALLDCTDHMARQLLAAARGNKTAEPTSNEEYRFQEEGDIGEIVTRSAQIRSLQEALLHFKVDTDVWRVDRYVVNQWGKGDMMQVKVWLKRHVPQPVTDALEMLVERSQLYVPWHEERNPTNALGRGHLLVMSLVDQHFGKLAHGEETGEDYDLVIAEELYVGAAKRTMYKASHYPIERVVLPVGNDLFHFDTGRGRTGNDTQMDFDSRPTKVFVAGCMATVKAIDHIVHSGANVDIMYIPGNHDPTWSHHLCVFLHGWYRNDERVSVDFSACPDKMIQFGTNLIYLTHGDVSQKNMAKIPLYVAMTHPQEWAAATTREIHMGHFHHEREMAFIPTAEETGVVMRILPSLCATDQWHFVKGFKGNRRLTLSFLYGKETGLEAILPVSAGSIE